MSSDPIRTKGGEYDAKRTTVSKGLEPITFVARSGASHLQDYFTAAQARDLGSRLMALALEVESAEAEIEHFDRIESEADETPAEARMRAECETSLALATSALPLIDAALGAESPAEAAGLTNEHGAMTAQAFSVLDGVRS